MGSKVIRIVNLDCFTTETSLKQFLLMCVPLTGTVENVFVRKDDTLLLIFAYAIFKYECDAKIITDYLNGFSYNNRIIEVELIGPNLSFKRYNHVSKQASVESIQRSMKNLTHYQSRTSIINQNKPSNERVIKTSNHILPTYSHVPKKNVIIETSSTHQTTSTDNLKLPNTRSSGAISRPIQYQSNASSLSTPTKNTSVLAIDPVHKHTQPTVSRGSVQSASTVYTDPLTEKILIPTKYQTSESVLSRGSLQSKSTITAEKNITRYQFNANRELSTRTVPKYNTSSLKPTGSLHSVSTASSACPSGISRPISSLSSQYRSNIQSSVTGTTRPQVSLNNPVEHITTTYQLNANRESLSTRVVPKSNTNSVRGIDSLHSVSTASLGSPSVTARPNSSLSLQYKSAIQPSVTSTGTTRPQVSLNNPVEHITTPYQLNANRESLSTRVVPKSNTNSVRGIDSLHSVSTASLGSPSVTARPNSSLSLQPSVTSTGTARPQVSLHNPVEHIPINWSRSTVHKNAKKNNCVIS